MKQLCIFVIDTNDFFSIMLENALGAQMSYRFTHYSNAEKVVKDLYLIPDIIILGDSLNDQEKIDLVSKIKNASSKAEIIIVSKPESDVKAMTALFKGGVYDYIIKDKEILKNISNSILNIHTMNTGIKKNRIFRKMGWD